MDIRLPSLLRLKEYKIILGSASPRRRELLKGLDIDFSIDSTSSAAETYPQGTPHLEKPRLIAISKSEGFHRALEPKEILITADTMVFVPIGNDDYEALGKPTDSEDAKRMLRLLSGKTHKVITGVCLRDNKRSISFSSCTDVSFRELTDNDINYYVHNYSPMDKAGAYAIQEWIGYTSISAINGSYFNVMGLPVQMLFKKLDEFTQ